MGQNLAIIWSTAPLDADDGDFPSRIQSWFNEVQKYSFGDAWSPKTGHYSQLVWGETSLVGCGYSEYKDTSKYNKLYVCNYGPGGNVVGYNPYEVGKPACDSYGMRPSSRYHGLCSAPADSRNAINTNSVQTYEYSQTNTYNSNGHTSNSFATTQYKQPVNNNNNYQPKRFGYPIPPRQSGTSSLYTTPPTLYNSNTNNNNNNNNKFKAKYEGYKPSKTEFQTAVRKHTILRTYINTSSKLQTQTLRNSAPVELVYDSDAGRHTSKSGWSLLTWRG